MLRPRYRWEAERRCVTLPNHLCRYDHPPTSVLFVLDNDRIVGMS